MAGKPQVNIKPNCDSSHPMTYPTLLDVIFKGNLGKFRGKLKHCWKLPQSSTHV